jgi:hypothetical protein
VLVRTLTRGLETMISSGVYPGSRYSGQEAGRSGSHWYCRDGVAIFGSGSESFSVTTVVLVGLGSWYFPYSYYSQFSMQYLIQVF